jgi:lipopolysaccharide transport protein LptA
MTITSDTLEGNYDQQNKIQKLTAKTNVLILKGDAIRGTSELAVYQAAQDVVTLTENPELSQNGSVLTADAIKIFLKDNRSEASGQVRVKMIDKKLGDSILGQGKAGL